jgi:hypothetical protein
MFLGALYREPRHRRHLGHRRSPPGAWPRSLRRCDDCGGQFGARQAPLPLPWRIVDWTEDHCPAASDA